MMLFVLLGWLLAVPVVIWWPRPAGENATRTRAYRTLRDAASCLLPGYALFAFVYALLLDVRPGDGFFLVIVLFFSFLGVVALTPFALGMLALDVGNRTLGLTGSVLAAIFAGGLTSFALLLLLSAVQRTIPFWYAAPALGAALLCGASAALVLEAYAVMRAPGGDTPQHPDGE